MKLLRAYEPERIVADETHPQEALRYLYYDRNLEMLIASNGYALVMLAAPPHPQDDSSTLSAEYLKTCRREQPRATVVNAPAIQPDSDYPNLRGAVPRFSPGDPGTVSLVINPTLLLELAKAIGMAKRRSTIRVTAMAPGLDGGLVEGPMLVSGGARGDEVAVIMPCTDKCPPYRRHAKLD